MENRRFDLARLKAGAKAKLRNGDEYTFSGMSPDGERIVGWFTDHVCNPKYKAIAHELDGHHFVDKTFDIVMEPEELYTVIGDLKDGSTHTSGAAFKSPEEALAYFKNVQSPFVRNLRVVKLVEL